jgi:hypothetical protein
MQLARVKNKLNYPFVLPWIGVILITLLSVSMTIAQKKTVIEGRIYNESTREPIPYANIFNFTNQQGTLSNEDGYFKVTISSARDSIIISCVGYMEYSFRISPGKFYVEVFMKENIYSISEVTIRPEKDNYLYELLQRCKPKKKSPNHQAKAYFSLKTYRNDHQVELLETYSNATIQGDELHELALKAGRMALRPVNDSLFYSWNSSKAIVLLNLFKKNPDFPTNPFSLSGIRLKKEFYLYLDQYYVDQNRDSIYVIAYEPKRNEGDYFKGKIWVNATKLSLQKITLLSDNVNRHPFLAFGSMQELKLQITKSYINRDDQIFLNHVDFNYELKYQSVNRHGITNEYTVKSQAVLYLYDYKRTFHLPFMGDYFERHSDYGQIIALPYNDFFWDHHDEYRMQDSLNSNETFFKHPLSLTNKNWTKERFRQEKGSFATLYPKWSEDRIMVQGMINSQESKGAATGLNIDKYHFEIMLFLDINTYKDSTHLLTYTILDPNRSFYYLPIDTAAHCFYNILFDMGEIERRKMAQTLEDHKHDPDHLIEIYNQSLKKWAAQSEEYIKDVKRGTDKSALAYYNDYVKKHLGIDNLKLWGLGSGNGSKSIQLKWK